MPTIEKLKDYLLPFTRQGIALAFSGGVDSALLLDVLREMRDEKPFPLLALTMVSRFQPSGEVQKACEQARAAGVESCVEFFEPLLIPELRENPPDRCYLCKKQFFRAFCERAQKRGIGVVVDGTNADDLKLYRPGLAAMKELGVRSPLAETGFSKAEIRKIAAERKLAVAQKPSAPCLATRFEYGFALTEQWIKTVDAGESLIRACLPESKDVRLRVHANGAARIEVQEDCFETLLAARPILVTGLKNLGFRYITFDLEGFRSGSMDCNKKQELQEIVP
ncbi:MAG: ATP-dependent sacrificial sulfur transferase LarE [Kiritimatiellia bacterium]